MWQVCVIPNNTTANLSLCYKTHKDAIYAFNRMKQAEVRIEESDDYGNSVFIGVSDISYMILIDVERSQQREFDQMQCVSKARAALEATLSAPPPKRSPIIQ